MDVPVAWAPPDGVAASWYGGSPTPWDKEYLDFARLKSNEGLSEIPFYEFAKLVADSMPDKPLSAEESALRDAEIALDRVKLAAESAGKDQVNAPAPKTLTVEERASMEAKSDELCKKMGLDIAPKSSDDGDFLHARPDSNGLPDPDAD